MIVYLAWRGYNYEGDELVGVFDSEEKAYAELATARVKYISADRFFVTSEEVK